MILGNNSRHHASAPHEVAEAYIQPAPYRTDETVKSDLNRLMVQVDDTQNLIAGQSYIRYPLGGGVALAGGSALLTKLLTNMRLIAVN